MRVVLAAAAVAGLAGPGATSAVADDCANAQYRTGAGAQLPDCRAWEQVSPVDKGGNDIMNTSAVVSSLDGSRAFFYAAGAFAGAETVTYETGYSGSRGPGDWTTRGVEAALSPASILIKATLGMSEDGTKAVVVSSRALAPGAIEGGSNLYVRDLTQPNAFRLILSDASSALYNELTGFGGQGFYIGGNADLSAIVLSSSLPLVDGAPDGTQDGIRQFYLWNDGEMTLATRLPDGSTPGIYQLATTADTGLRSLRPISQDGTRTWFFAGESGYRGLYQRVATQSTSTLVSRSHRAGDDPTAPIPSGSAIASPDGRTLTFVADRQLTDATSDAGITTGSIYRWSEDGDELVDLLAPHVTPGLGNLAGMFMQAVSPDGRFVWFTTSKALVPDSEVPNAARLYVLDTQADQLHLAAGQPRSGFYAPGLRFSDNGRHVAFQSFASIGGFDNEDPVCRTFGNPGDDGFCGNVYRWSVETPSEGPECLSCGPEGTRRNGPAAGFGYLATTFDGRQSRAVLDDGRVFFESSERLVPGDGNDVADVYQYTPGRGLALVSSGVSGEAATFGDAAPDGNSVFFTTADRLVPQDVDVLADLYVARIGGGIASQHVAPRDPSGGCNGDSCRPSVVPQPERPLLGGAAQFEAPVVGPAPTLRVRAVSASALRTAARTGRLLVPVSVTGSGTVRATLTGTIAGKSGRTAARATRKATKAATYRLSLRLTKAARSELRRKGKLRLRLAVEYSEDIKEYRKTVTLTANRTSTSKKGGAR
ncbi:MAG: hypothetical protein WC558_11200 [Patulibacter sp.]